MNSKQRRKNMRFYTAFLRRDLATLIPQMLKEIPVDQVKLIEGLTALQVTVSQNRRSLDHWEQLGDVLDIPLRENSIDFNPEWYLKVCAICFDKSFEEIANGLERIVTY
jgi:hypothetical protein